MLLTDFNLLSGSVFNTTALMVPRKKVGYMDDVLMDFNHGIPSNSTGACCQCCCRWTLLKVTIHCLNNLFSFFLKFLCVLLPKTIIISPYICPRRVFTSDGMKSERELFQLPNTGNFGAVRRFVWEQNTCTSRFNAFFAGLAFLDSVSFVTDPIQFNIGQSCDVVLTNGKAGNLLAV